MFGGCGFEDAFVYGGNLETLETLLHLGPGSSSINKGVGG